MKSKRRHPFLFTLIIVISCLVFAGTIRNITIAQQDCPTHISQIIAQANTMCTDICEGNVSQFSIPNSDASNLATVLVSQIPVSNLTEIKTGSYDISGINQIALFQSPSTMIRIKFWQWGNVQFGWEQTAGNIAPTTPVSALTKTDAPIYADANLQSAQINNLPSGAMPEISHISPDKQWAQIVFNGQTGWVNIGSLYISPDDLTRLSTVDGNLTTFYLSITDNSLNSCTPNFMLMQADDNGTTIIINGATIRFTSLILLHIDSSFQFEIIVLDGTAQIESTLVEAGMASAAPLATDGRSLAGGWSVPRALLPTETDVINQISEVMLPKTLENTPSVPTPAPTTGGNNYTPQGSSGDGSGGSGTQVNGSTATQANEGSNSGSGGIVMPTPIPFTPIPPPTTECLASDPSCGSGNIGG